MKRVAIAALVLLALGATAAPTLAQSGEGAPLGFIGVSASNTMHDRYVDVQPSIPFTFYVWAKVDFGQIGQPTQNTSNGLKGWEAQVSIPAEMFVLSTTLEPTNALNFGDVPGEFIIGTGALVRADTGVALATIQALVTSAVTDLTLSLSGTSPSSVDPAAPMWLEWLDVNGCTLPGGGPTNCKRPFDNVGDMKINWTGVPVQQTSFGTLKAGYDQ